MPLYLGLGSNLGDRHRQLQLAVDQLAQRLVIQAISPVYETTPWGETNQPAFLNCCVAATGAVTPASLIADLQRIEHLLGRRPSYRWGPRAIDIDLLFFGNWICHTSDLTIPHPRVAERAFVLAPLADIAPNFVHPLSGLTVSEMLAATDRSGIVRVPEPLWLPVGGEGAHEP